MKTFNGDIWVDGSQDTGKRDITSSVNFSVIPYYYRDAPNDDDLYQVKPGDVDMKVMVRRRDFKVTLTVDINSVKEFSANCGTIIPPGASSIIKKIGAPVGSVASHSRVVFSSATNPTPPNTVKTKDNVLVLGSGLDIPSTKQNSLVWIGHIDLSPGRFIVQWVTSDPFPTTSIGVGA